MNKGRGSLTGNITDGARPISWAEARSGGMTPQTLLFPSFLSKIAAVEAGGGRNYCGRYKTIWSSTISKV